MSKDRIATIAKPPPEHSGFVAMVERDAVFAIAPLANLARFWPWPPGSLFQPRQFVRRLIFCHPFAVRRETALALFLSQGRRSFVPLAALRVDRFLVPFVVSAIRSSLRVRHPTILSGGLTIAR